MNFLSKWNAEAYGALRIVTGLMFSFHGAQKIFGVLTDPSMMPPPGTQLWFGGIIELIGGLLICVGFFTRYAAFLASGEMAVAYFQVHWRFALGTKFFPIVNHGEMAVLYCFLFFFIATQGGGKWSFDGCMKKK